MKHIIVFVMLVLLSGMILFAAANREERVKLPVTDLSEQLLDYAKTGHGTQKSILSK